MINSIPAERGSRRGTGLLPPNPLQWECENHGLDLRRELGVSVGVRLEINSVFALIAGARVIAHGEVACADLFLKHFRVGNGRWSGLAIRLSDGSDLVIYNDSHAETRVRATLMEEFFHLRLNHPRSVIRLLTDGSHARSLDTEIERVAYGSGAAALVPFLGLKSLCDQRLSTREIAGNYGVSTDLVQYRMNVTRLRRKHR